jgi:CheY-like chemotaxis protein
MAEYRAASPPSATKRPSTNSSTRRVLVVDDNVDGALTLSALLRRCGLETATAHDGMSALNHAGDFMPDVVLLDIGMPRMNGYDVARQIRQQPWGQEIILVAMTGWVQEEDQRRAELAGFDYHLTKPLDTAALQEILEGLGASR